MTPTWTLLLIGPRYLTGAVVVGGYLSEDEATRAGCYACAQVAHDKQGLPLDDGLSVITRYVVIPGPPLADPLIVTNAAPHRFDAESRIPEQLPFCEWREALKTVFESDAWRTCPCERCRARRLDSPPADRPARHG